MDILGTYKKQLEMAQEEFGHIVAHGEILSTPAGLPQKLRLEVIDDSIVDIFLSSSGRYSYHWERRPIDGTIYRHDNAPHQRWKHIATFPKHFHNGSEADEDVEASVIGDDPVEALRQFLHFVEATLGSS